MYTALTHASPLSVCVRAHECEVGTFDFALPIRSASESHTRLVRAFALIRFWNGTNAEFEGTAPGCC